MKTIMKERFITPAGSRHCKPSFTRWVLPMKTATDLSASSQPGRTDSTSGLTKEEAGLLLSRFNKEAADRIRKEARAVVKQIFSLSFQISCLNRNYTNDTPEDFEMNKAKINQFCRTRSKFRKPLTEMSLEELKEVKRQFEAMARKEEK